MIKLENVSKFYYSKGVIAVGFSKVNLNFDVGEFVAITGESGSGKSTLLNVISGLDSYEEGEMYIDGSETSHFTEKDFENYRRRYIGNIFQNFNLVNSYTVYQNIELVMLLNGSKRKEIKARVNDLIDKVGLTEYKHTKASKLSGGQKQRVAIARALAKDTPIIIADEPTGNLDSESAAGIIKLLSEIARDKLVIIVTHNYDQVEPYVTRKIKMHDGRVLEDTVIRKRDEDIVPSPTNEYNNMRPLSQLRLGIRNAFNIPVKFLLLTFVFLFISAAMISELSVFQSQNHDSSISGWNYYFNNTSENRIVIKKKDGTSISSQDFSSIQKIPNVDFIEKNDILVDSTRSFEDTNKGDIYLSGNLRSLSKFEGKLDKGRMPEKDNEIIAVVEKDDHLFSKSADSILNTTFKMYGSETDAGNERVYKFVGIKYLEEGDSDSIYGQMPGGIINYVFYVSDAFLEDVLIDSNKEYGSMSVDFAGKTYTENNAPYPLFNVAISSKVEKGTAVVSTQLNDYVKNGKAVGNELKLNVKTPYYSDSKTLKISGTYTKNNYKKYYAGADDFTAIDGVIFVNPDDYKSLYDKETFQSSVFVTDPLKVEETAKALRESGYKTLVIKDTLFTYGEEMILKIVSYIVTFGLAVTLFFISYFVIRIILKSRNVYYSTIRMLGANVSVSRHLLILDLMTDANIAYAVTLLGVKLLSLYKPDMGLIKAMTQFMGAPEYIAIYVIVLVISILISLRYSKKLFKNTTINTIKEEV